MYNREYELVVGQNLSAAAAEELSQYNPSAAFDSFNLVTPGEGFRPVESPEDLGPSPFDTVTGVVTSQEQALAQFYTLGEVYKNNIQTYDIDNLIGRGDNRVTIKDSHVKFDIEKAGAEATEGNVAEITVYNLANDTAALLANLTKVKNFIELRAGYSDEGIKTIFRGNVEEVEDTFDGKERRTKIICSDGGPFIQNQRTARRYPKGTRWDKIIDDLLNDLALDRGAIARLGEDVVTRRQQIFHGSAAGELKRILEMFDWNLNIQDMYAYIVSSRVDAEVGQGPQQGRVPFAWAQNNDIAQIPSISYATGLVETPTFNSDSGDLSQNELRQKSVAGVEFKSLLNGAILPNNLIKLVTESDVVSGIYRVIKVTHTGSLRGDEWFTEVEAELVPVESLEAFEETYGIRDQNRANDEDEPAEDTEEDSGIFIPKGVSSVNRDNTENNNYSWTTGFQSLWNDWTSGDDDDDPDDLSSEDSQAIGPGFRQR